jgi:hypothetical protein
VTSPLRRTTRVVVAALLGFAIASCAGGGRSRGPRTSQSELSRAQILEGHYLNAYDAVEALRSHWLRTRGPDSFASPSQVWVYIDGSRLGDVGTLRQVQSSMIESIRWIDGVTATGQWGVGHSAGVIAVRTFSSRPGPRPPSDGDEPRDAARGAS